MLNIFRSCVCSFAMWLQAIKFLLTWRYIQYNGQFINRINLQSCCIVVACSNERLRLWAVDFVLSHWWERIVSKISRVQNHIAEWFYTRDIVSQCTPFELFQNHLSRQCFASINFKLLKIYASDAVVALINFHENSFTEM